MKNKHQLHYEIEPIVVALLLSTNNLSLKKE